MARFRRFTYLNISRKNSFELAVSYIKKHGTDGTQHVV
jgi:hypothetical protein